MAVAFVSAANAGTASANTDPRSWNHTLDGSADGYVLVCVMIGDATASFPTSVTVDGNATTNLVEVDHALGHGVAIYGYAVGTLSGVIPMVVDFSASGIECWAASLYFSGVSQLTPTRDVDETFGSVTAGNNLSLTLTSDADDVVVGVASFDTLTTTTWDGAMTARFTSTSSDWAGVATVAGTSPTRSVTVTHGGTGTRVATLGAVSLQSSGGGGGGPVAQPQFIGPGNLLGSGRLVGRGRLIS